MHHSSTYWSACYWLNLIFRANKRVMLNFYIWKVEISLKLGSYKKKKKQTETKVVWYKYWRDQSPHRYENVWRPWTLLLSWERNATQERGCIDTKMKRQKPEQSHVIYSTAAAVWDQTTAPNSLHRRQMGETRRCHLQRDRQERPKPSVAFTPAALRHLPKPILAWSSPGWRIRWSQSHWSTARAELQGGEPPGQQMFANPEVAPQLGNHYIPPL